MTVTYVDLRRFGLGKSKQVDDYPYSDQQGMLIRADVLVSAIKSIDHYQDYQVIYMNPKGKTLDQEQLNAFKKTFKKVIIVSGFYEGVDQRFFDLFDVLCVSVGDYVLSSGDLPALVLAEGLLRLSDTYSKDSASIQSDSFVSGLLEPRRFTRPETVCGLNIPKILSSGHHQHIANWMKKDALKETLMYKPSLLCTYFDKIVSEGCYKPDKENLTQVLKEISKSE